MVLPFHVRETWETLDEEHNLWNSFLQKSCSYPGVEHRLCTLLHSTTPKSMTQSTSRSEFTMEPQGN